MTIICSFPPIADTSSRTLILGSMPGAASLAAQQYYAHPRNAFWPIMGELVGALPHLSYDLRLDNLRTANIAVWDVLKHCVRPGSLDSAITDEEPNDFAAFFSEHCNISRIFFNGAKAESAFKRHIDRKLAEGKLLHRLPSTSPAHAGRSIKAKLDYWRVVAAESHGD